jgi:hypothetical protein
LKIRTTREQHQEGSSWDLFDQETQELKGGWVGPVQVFDDQEDWLSFGKFEPLRDSS